MAESRSFVRLETASGQRVQVGDIAVTPISQALTARLPFGGLVWNRPASVLIERSGQTEIIPIVDVTRLVQLGLLAFTLVISIVVWTESSRRKEHSRE
jgi:hypothetical protein